MDKGRRNPLASIAVATTFAAGTYVLESTGLMQFTSNNVQLFGSTV